MDPPFLDLAYYVGEGRVEAALESIASAVDDERRAPRVIGLDNRPEEVLARGPRMVVRTEGEDFCGPDRDDLAKREKLGRQVYEAFVRTAERIDCIYGAILVEYTLETPEELCRDPRSYAFRNFFLSRQKIPNEIVVRVLSLVPAKHTYEKCEAACTFPCGANSIQRGGRLKPTCLQGDREHRACPSGIETAGVAMKNPRQALNRRSGSYRPLNSRL